VKGAGVGFSASNDAFHFAYQPLSGDGTIVARVLSAQSIWSAGVMIRETLAPGSTLASVERADDGAHYFYYYFGWRPSAGGGTGSQTGPIGNMPYWVKLVRSGNTFTGYTSVNAAVDWTQIGTSVTVSMAANVDVGLAVDSGNTYTLATASFDNVSINSTAAPAPAITSVSATTGSIGSQVTITGSHFGASQGSSLVTLNALPMTINSWSDTSISTTIASGAETGLLVVSVGPSMNDSNPVTFTVTTQPLPSGWLDQDIGSVGLAGSAGYSSGTFTVKGAGAWSGTADAFHFAYKTLSGDGTIVARLVSPQSIWTAGVMIRETLAPGSTHASTDYGDNGTGNFLFAMSYRTSTGGNTTSQSGPYYLSLPYWVKVTRSGNTFAGYISPDGVYWTQVGSSVSISMAANVDIGLVVNSGNTYLRQRFSHRGNAVPHPEHHWYKSDLGRDWSLGDCDRIQFRRHPRGQFGPLQRLTRNVDHELERHANRCRCPQRGLDRTADPNRERGRQQSKLCVHVLQPSHFQFESSCRTRRWHDYAERDRLWQLSERQYG
jgi:hypothetical protein